MQGTSSIFFRRETEITIQQLNVNHIISFTIHKNSQPEQATGQVKLIDGRVIKLNTDETKKLQQLLSPKNGSSLDLKSHPSAVETINLVGLSEQLSVLGESARKLLKSSELDLHYQRRTTLNYETELIQIAASAIAALLDLRLQQSLLSKIDVNLEIERIEREIHQERDRQDSKFGCLPRRLDPLIWIAVLIEELAEASEEIYG